MSSERWKCRQCHFLSDCSATPLELAEKAQILRTRELAQGLSDIESPPTCRQDLRRSLSQTDNEAVEDPSKKSALQEPSSMVPFPKISQPSDLEKVVTSSPAKCTDLFHWRGDRKRTVKLLGPTGVSPLKKQPLRSFPPPKCRAMNGRPRRQEWNLRKDWGSLFQT
eukprot:Gregarina_sp_Poly_1__5508@NODE_2906_length_1559_cov_251_959786_g82_i2_p2_GENE_NODE_2906_length_1559_cov_251_959786_g82_i2NODE_2906_length_1559_cov_251_959786_g82_i2_p2_ORF_typecomplete_len166_score21_99_NODE_2906_length_1559_cov_251_959786_g82_i2213710